MSQCICAMPKAYRHYFSDYIHRHVPSMHSTAHIVVEMVDVDRRRLCVQAEMDVVIIAMSTAVMFAVRVFFLKDQI